ncbi:hypothetical protein [Aurantiacibacter marinus]|nr:hypothetical protein [Aurantiacibacter marinus]
MTTQITPRRVIAFIGIVALVYFAGYGVGSIGAKAVINFTDDAPAEIRNS